MAELGELRNFETQLAKYTLKDKADEKRPRSRGEDEVILQNKKTRTRVTRATRAHRKGQDRSDGTPKWKDQNPAVEADTRMDTDAHEDAVMQDADDHVTEPSTRTATPGISVFGNGASFTSQEGISTDEDEMYPSPPQSSHPTAGAPDESDPNAANDFASHFSAQASIMAPSTAGTPRINWQYLYKQRRKLESNWNAGRFVNFQLPHRDFTWEGHRECIYTIQYSGNYLVSGSRDRTLRIWDLKTKRLVRKPLVGHKGSVLCLQFDASEDEDIIISGSSDSDVILWRFSTGEMIQKIEHAHRESVLNLRFDKRYLVTCSKDKTIKVWSRHELSAGHPDFPKPSSPWGSEPFKFSPKVIDVATGGTSAPSLPPYTRLMTLTGHGAAVNAIQMHENQIVSASGDRHIRVWDVSSGDCIQMIQAHQKGIACVQFDGRRIVSGSSDNSVRIFDRKTGIEVAWLVGHNHLVRTVQAGFGDLPWGAEDDLAEARAIDQNFFASGRDTSDSTLKANREHRWLRNAGSKKPGDVIAIGAAIPPGGGGSKWAKIVSGSYDETIIIWKRDSEGKWVPGHQLKQEDAARRAGGSAAEYFAKLSGTTNLLATPGAPTTGTNQPTPVFPTNSTNGMPNAPGAAPWHMATQNQDQTFAQQQQQPPPNLNQATGNPVPPSDSQLLQPPPQASATAPTGAPLPPATNLAPNGHVNPNNMAEVARHLIVSNLAQIHGGGTPEGIRAAADSMRNPRVFKLQFDARRIICCSQDPRIVGWDFANGDVEVEEASRFFTNS